MSPHEVGAPSAPTDARQRIAAALAAIVRRMFPDAASLSVQVERPRDAAHGDYATNFALSAAKVLRRKPRELADALAHALRTDVADLVAKVDVAGPGFINVTLTNAARQRVVHDILVARERFGRSDARHGERVLVEFVSANPTGPLQVGHGRQAALGDAISNLL
ncbi:MAG TPA: arginine--tRNA ligase, partial [Casimicrobiaceae bacterium]